MQKARTNLNRVAMKLEKVLNENNQSKTKNPNWENETEICKFRGCDC